MQAFIMLLWNSSDCQIHFVSNSTRPQGAKENQSLSSHQISPVHFIPVKVCLWCRFHLQSGTVVSQLVSVGSTASVCKKLTNFNVIWVYKVIFWFSCFEGFKKATLIRLARVWLPLSLLPTRKGQIIPLPT